MKKILITGAGSYVGESVKKYMLAHGDYLIDAVDTMGDNWKMADYSQYDVVYHVAGIAHVNADPKMEALYYKVNRDLTIEVAKYAKAAGVKQFIFMSSQIVFHESQSLKSEIITKDTKENPNGFYGDSKLQAEMGLWGLNGNDNHNHMKICILRPCMIYGPNAKGNFPRLAKLACKTPFFEPSNLTLFAMMVNLCLSPPVASFHLFTAILPSTATNLPFFTYSPANSACLSHTSTLNQSVTSAFVFASHLFTAKENVVFTLPDSKYLMSGSCPVLPTITAEFIYYLFFFLFLLTTLL